MLRVASVVLALAAPPAATLHSGETRWFQPGRLQPGATVACVTPAGSLLVTVPQARAGATVASDAWRGRVQASVEVRPNGAVQVDCGKPSTAPSRPTMPYVVGRNGLGLIRGTNTLARVRRLYGAGAASAGRSGCAVTWARLGLRAAFSGCSGSSRLTSARVTGARWSSLEGVGIGQSLAQLRFQDRGARRVGRNRWLLGGVGGKRPPRLVAVLAHGAVVALELEPGR